MGFILPWSLFGVGVNMLHAGVVEMLVFCSILLHLLPPAHPFACVPAA